MVTDKNADEMMARIMGKLVSKIDDLRAQQEADGEQGEQARRDLDTHQRLLRIIAREPGETIREASRRAKTAH